MCNVIKSLTKYYDSYILLDNKDFISKSFIIVLMLHQLKGVTSVTGGGVSVFSSGIFNMSGGTISGNRASGGGGVTIDNGQFRMTGGIISNNIVSLAGGGVLFLRGSFIMSGGSITENRASNFGGGVVIQGSGFQQTGGSIRRNTAPDSPNIFRWR